jgi:hypothetical protein
MAHASGPWEVATIKESYAVSTLEGDDGKRLCVCVIAGVQCPGSLVAAHLIAATPELLEVCRKLLAWQSEDDPYACDDWMEFATDLGAMAGHAIAKAEGITMEDDDGKERSLD